MDEHEARELLLLLLLVFVLLLILVLVLRQYSSVKGTCSISAAGEGKERGEVASMVGYLPSRNWLVDVAFYAEHG